MKYRLLKDCPHGKKDSVWEWVISDLEESILLQNDKTKKRIYFPTHNLNDWFEEIKEMKKFTKEQRASLEEAVSQIFEIGIAKDLVWTAYLNATTEK